jgi:hypothetical protein
MINKEKLEDNLRFNAAKEFFDKAIEDEVGIKLSKDVFVAGGAIRAFHSSSERIKDIDIFFTSEEHFAKAALEIDMESANVIVEDEKHIKIKNKKYSIDLIRTVFGNPEEIISKFDFSVCMFALDSEYFYYEENSFIDLSKKQIMINTITYPASTLLRLLKYTRKGYRICNNELYKVLKSINEHEIKVAPEKEEEKKIGYEFFAGID